MIRPPLRQPAEPRHFLDRSRMRPYSRLPTRHLLKRKPMTIAIGLLAQNSIVIGADTEQVASGLYKAAGCKIRSHTRQPYHDGDGALIPGAVCTISGSGPSEYVDAISDALL